MQEEFPIFLLIAAGLLELSDRYISGEVPQGKCSTCLERKAPEYLSPWFGNIPGNVTLLNVRPEKKEQVWINPYPGASSNEDHVSEVLGLIPPGEAQPRAESSPMPSEGFSIPEDASDNVTFNFQSSAVDATSEMTAEFAPVHAEIAAQRTAVLPKEADGSLEVHTETAALNLQDEHRFPSKLLGRISIPVSTQGSQVPTHLEQPERSLQGEPENITEAGFSPTSSDVPQPPLSGGIHHDSHDLTAASSVPVAKQMEVPSPKTSLVSSTVHFHPPRKESAASLLPIRVKIALESARVDWLPTGMPPASKMAKGTKPHAQPDSRVGVTPASLKKTQSMDVKVTTSAFPQKAASGDHDAVYSRMTQTSAIRFSPAFSLTRETTGTKARNSTAAVIKGSEHPTQLPALQPLPLGNVQSPLLMHLEALVHGDLLPSPFQEPVNSTDRQQSLSFSQTLNCTEHVSQETNKSSHQITAPVLQRHTDRWMMTSKPENSRFPQSPQASADAASLSQSWISTLKLSQTPQDLKGVSSALYPGMSKFGNAALHPVSTSDSVPAGLPPLGPSSPTHVGSQLMGIPTSAEKGLHISTSSMSTGAGSQVQGITAHSEPQEAFPVVLQMSTVEDSKRKKSPQQETGETASSSLTPQAGLVPSPAALRDNGNQDVPLHSSAPPASQSQQAGSLAALAPKLPSLPAQGSQSSSAPAHPATGVPSVSHVMPAYLAQALLQQFSMSHDPATKSSSYLSFLLKSTDGMICLQPMQDSPLPTKFPNTSVGALVSIQQILAASNSSLLDLANSQIMSPSSLILVKPVFILLPTDRPDLQSVPSPGDEDDHKAALLFTNTQDLELDTSESSHDIPMKTSSSYATIKLLRPETTLSTVSNQQAEKLKVTSQPVLTNPNSTAITSVFQAVTSGSNPLLDPGMRLSTTVQAMHLHRLLEEMHLPAPVSQEAKGTDLLFLNGMLAEPFTSTVPPLAVPTKPSPPVSPKVFLTAEKPRSSSSVIPLLTAEGPYDFQMLTQPPFTVVRTVGQLQHGTKPMLQATGHHQGLGTTSPSVHTQCTECLALHSARTIKPPLNISASIVPLQSALKSLLSTESLKRLPSQVHFVAGTSSAYSALGAGNGGRGSAAHSTACAGVIGCAKAAQTHTTSLKPELTTPLVPKPLLMTVSPPAAPAHTLFSTKVQMETTASGKLLASITHPRMYTSSPASPPSPASTHVPPLSAMKYDQIHQAPPQLFSQANMGENTKPTATSTSARKAGTGKFLRTSVPLSAMFNTTTQQPPTTGLGNKVVLTTVQPPVSLGYITALERQSKLTQITSPSPLAVTSLSTATNDDIATSLTKKKVFLLPTSAIQSDPNMVLPAIARVNNSTEVSIPMEKGKDMLVKGDSATTSQLPTQVPISSSARQPLEKVSLEDIIEPEAGRSRPDTVRHAAGSSTTKAFSVSASRLVKKVTNQSAVFSKVAVNDAEMLLARDVIQVLPTPESPSYSPGSPVVLTPQGNSLLGVANTEQSESLFLKREAEEMLQTNKVTEEAAEGLVTVLTQLDSEPSALLSESHQRRVSHSEAAILNGLAVVTDDVCGSGNYTVQMSLRPAAESGPELEGSVPPQETFLALIAVQGNSSQPWLQIRSCCVTPSASPGGPGAVCCLFRRLPFECRHIQLLPSRKSRAASFTIQLFQMLNHSVAYLHCELNVCLHGKAGCEQDCFESVETILQPSDRRSYGNLHNLISFGPVLRMKNGFLYKPVAGPDSALLVPILLGSLTGFAALSSAFISLWLHNRQKTKTIHYPHLGDIYGL